MSDAFGFVFGFYALLLGLAVTEIAAGFSRAYDERKRRPIGVIAPLFATVLLLDLITFWLGAWEFRQIETVNFPIAVGAGLVALLYYFAATQVFPKEGDVDTLTAHILQTRKTVVFSVIVSNLIAVSPVLAAGISDGVVWYKLAAWAAVNALYYSALIVAAMARNQKVIIATLGLVIAYIVSATTLLA